MQRGEPRGDCIVVGLFDRPDDAMDVMRDLQDRGVPASSITVDQPQGDEPAVRQSLVQKLRDVVTGQDSHRYAEGVRRGGTVVSATVPQALVDEAIEVMEQHDAVDVDERSESWRASGWVEQREEAAEKRGRVRVYRRPTDPPLEGVGITVERVVFGRRAGDRADDEEVVFVAVEDEGRQRRDEGHPFAADFADHFRARYASTGDTYDEYDAAYRWGYTLASQDEWRGRPWEEVERHAHRTWEGGRPGTWERFRDAIRYGWDRLTGQTPATQR